MSHANDFNASHYISGSFIYVKASAVTNLNNGTLELYNLFGQKIVSKNIILSAEQKTYQLDKPFVQGIYLLRIISDDQLLYNTKVFAL